MTYYLWKYSQTEPSFSFFKESELPEMGFASLYGVSEADAKSMLTVGSFAGYRGSVDPGPYLWIDCDTTDSAIRTEDRLKELGVEYQVWQTGNRGLHFAVKRKLSASQHVPEIDKEWVKKNCPGADLRLYSHLHLFRRPGAIHEKTGLKKSIAASHPGSTLFLEYSGRKISEPKRIDGVTSVFANQSIIEYSMIPYQSGTNRRKYLSKLALEIAKTGNSKDFALTWMLNVNMLGEGLEETDLARIVDWAYAEVGER